MMAGNLIEHTEDANEKNKLPSAIAVLLGLILILLVTGGIYFHTKRNPLASEDVTKCDFFVTLMTKTEKAVQVMVLYKERISVYNSPGYIALRNVESGEEIEPT